jgi:hypothetical protein
MNDDPRTAWAKSVKPYVKNKQMTKPSTVIHAYNLSYLGGTDEDNPDARLHFN